MRYLLSFSILLIALAACSISFSGLSIDPAIYSTYFVPNFKNNAPNAFPGLEQELAEALRQKLRTEARLQKDETNPDIEMNGTLVDYRVTSEAPRPGESVALNRLTLVLAIEYIDNKDEEKSWKSNFSHFENFDSNQDLSAVEADLILSITDQLMEDIFNKAFTDW